MKSLLFGLVEAVAGTHPGTQAAPRLLGYTAVAREAANVPVLPAEHLDLDRWIAAVRALHGDAFGNEFAAGQSMTRADAITMASALESSG